MKYEYSERGRSGSAHVLLMLCFAFFLAALSGGASAAACAGAGAGMTGDVACTDLGAVRGQVENGTLAFKGIPYAKPPVGDLRWRAPQAAVAWSGTRDTVSYAPMCPQIIGKDVVGSEDCLYLNVWRPVRKPKHPLPVMVWLHGGGNQSYSGAGDPGFGGVVYDGEKLVPQGVVFVSYSLRVGVLGFLAHPSLDAESPEKISGNYGSQDQIAMLQWLHRNIAAFGGDPSKVFLFGTSAGGGNICALLTSPKTKGLIHGVSMQSSVPTGCEIPTLADVERGTGKAVIAKAGCESSSDIAACLRGKTAAEIVNAVPAGPFTVFPRVYGPNMDGHVFVDQPLALIKQRKYPPVPVIIGNTAGETMHFIDAVGPVVDAATFAGAVSKVFGSAQADRIVAQYPLDQYETPRAAFVQLTTDGEFTCQSRRVARTFADVQSEPVFRYIFNHALENDPEQKALGPTHTAEHPYMFNWKGTYKPTQTDLDIQKHIISYWSRMAKTGNPNGGSDPFWPNASSLNAAYLEIGTDTQSKTGVGESHCDFWDTVQLPWPHL
ncbi:carboxylesterase family protein [Oxalobacteraceae bacterium CAVE-383]|nr:carboxylesterase family protein [Oxalobacteraceae bacterium CAVE-383]